MCWIHQVDVLAWAKWFRRGERFRGLHGRRDFRSDGCHEENDKIQQIIETRIAFGACACVNAGVCLHVAPDSLIYVA